MKIALALLPLLFAATPSSGEVLYGNDVLTACESNEDAPLQGFCAGYVFGVF